MTDLVDDEVYEGYRDGRSDERDSLPASMANRSDAYVFGWLNGRDDRLRKPRAKADDLRKRAAELRAAAVSLAPSSIG